MATKMMKVAKNLRVVALGVALIAAEYYSLKWFPMIAGPLLALIVGRTVYETSKPKKKITLKRIVEGNINSKTTIFMIHGWPDNPDIWNKQLKDLSQFRIVRVQQPNFGSDEHPWGFSFDEVTDLISDALKADLAESGNTQATLCIHDWGAYVGMMVQRRSPHLVDRMIVMDVVWTQNKPMKAIDMVVMSVAIMFLGTVYQFWASASFVVAASVPLVGKPVGDEMLKLMLQITPHVPETSFANRATPPHASMCFFYFYFQFEGIKEILGIQPAFDVRHKTTNTPVSWAADGVPTLYFHGADKPFPFHPPWYPKKVEKQPKGRVVALRRGDEGCPITVGHWLQVTASERVNKEILQWLKDTSA